MTGRKADRKASRCRRVWQAAALMLAFALPLHTGLWAAPAEDSVIGELGSVTTSYEDTLHDVALASDLGFVELVAANPGVDPWLPGEGTLVLLPTRHVVPDAPRKGVVINLPELRLYYFPPDGGAVQTYPLGVGRAGLTTPVGDTRIVRKQEKPTWYPTKSTRADNPDLPAVVPPGPDNPLGEYAMYLGWPTYLIHGTNNPWGIGRRVSRGCIRMYPKDVERLFPQIRPGTPVTVVDQPIKLGWWDGDLFIEAHPTQRQVDQIEATGDFEPVDDVSLTERVLAAAGEAARRVDWARVRQAATQRRGYPVQITR